MKPRRPGTIDATPVIWALFAGMALAMVIVQTLRIVKGL